VDDVIGKLEERGLIDTLTSEELRKIVQKPIRLYCGFDPTADSLHVGNLVGMMVLAHFQRCGHQPIALIGGATGLIGDPGGKSIERPLLDEESWRRNRAGITADLQRVLDRGHPPIFLDNYDWFSNMGVIPFLRDVGRHFRLGPMLAKESVKARLESEEGMSFTEFSYQCLQGYDFYHLYHEQDVILQIGGSDQWGNITAGTDLIRKLTGKTAFGLTFPLLTRSDGKKFGKSEEGAIWLSPDKLSPYEFYQFFVRTADADVIKLMKFLTFMEIAEISEWERKLQSGDCEPNSAQRRLAEEITRFIHGEEAVQKAIQITAGLLPGKVSGELTAEALEQLVGDMPSCDRKRSDVIGSAMVDLLVSCGLFSSKGEARRMLAGGGIYLNHEKVESDLRRIEEADLIDGRLLLLGAGKKRKLLIRLQLDHLE
jgi:tyrosyl-tRNA synthetase